MFYLYAIAIALFFLSAHSAKAVPPPDFIFNVTSQIAQFFSISVILLSAAGSIVYRFFQQHFAGKQKLVFWIIAGIGALALSGGGAWLYGQRAQQNELKQWLAESEQYDQNAVSNSTDGIDQETTANSTQEAIAKDSLDQLILGNGTSTTVAPTQPDDEVTTFIRAYYDAIATHQFDVAYAMSKKSVSLETFKGWYTETESISINKIQRIDKKRTSLELALVEQHTKTRYGVLMDVRLDSSGKPIAIEQSTVRILSEQAEAVDKADTSDPSYYWNTFLEKSLSISNADFQSAIDLNAPMIVLDAREDIEFENGHFPDATHVRFADLKAGRWIELPTDRPVYVFCWSGIRGKEVVEFLRTKKIAAQYLEKGANGWVSDNGKWIGEIAFLKVYTDDQYKRVFSLNDFQNSIKDGTVIIDSRSPASFNAWHIPGSVNIPLMYTPSISIDQTFEQVPKNSRVITVCDEYVNCFDAKLTGAELERRGHTFLGRFVEPWKLKSR